MGGNSGEACAFVNKVQKRNTKHPGHKFRHYGGNWHLFFGHKRLYLITNRHTRANTALSNLVATHRFVKEGRKGVRRREEAVFESSSRVGVSTQTQSYIFLFPFNSAFFKSAATVTYLTNSSREIDREIRRLRHCVCFKKNNCIWQHKKRYLANSEGALKWPSINK